MRSYVFTLAAGAQRYIAADGDTIYCKAATGDATVTARDDKGDGKDLLSLIVMRQNSRVRSRGRFDTVLVQNTGAASIDLTFVIGFGDYSDAPTVVALEVPNGGAGGKVTATAAGAKLADASTEGKRVHVQVDFAAANGCFVAYTQADAVAGNGMQLVPGVGFTFETRAELWVARDGAADCLVRFMTETLS